MDYYLYIIHLFELKLRELMGEEAYTEFVIAVTKKAFQREVEGMAPSDFKDCILENFDEITKPVVT